MPKVESSAENSASAAKLTHVAIETFSLIACDSEQYTLKQRKT
jgi:hypothetical protein